MYLHRRPPALPAVVSLGVGRRYGSPVAVGQQPRVSPFSSRFRDRLLLPRYRLLFSLARA
ncbi:unnamed protein product [Citrullus colocynthis]|uniref:Uncharacterized protein n=1 Tax=Citrullus colocynthis TaxID=252529 RepID=A0ABP0YEL5_9ROSI